MSHANSSFDLPVISSVEEFDRSTGSLLERLVFNNRVLVMAFCTLATFFLAYHAKDITLQAGFEKMLPKNHPYVINYQENKKFLKGLGNNLTLSIKGSGESIFEKDYLQTLESLNDQVFFIPGVDRTAMKSLFTPNTRWRVVTEEGFAGGPVMPGYFDGSPQKIEELTRNVRNAGIVGSLVANDLESSSIVIPLRARDPETGERLDYYSISRQLEDIRTEYQGISADEQGTIDNPTPTGYTVYITGFAKIVGELIDGLFAVMGFFAIAVVIATLLLFLYTRCLRSTLTVIACTLIAICWQIGILAMLGYELDPYSILVPFLVFAIGVSHGAQKLNGVLQDVARGTHKYVAARYTFRRLFLAGVTALLSDGVGFAVLMIIQIQVIQDLAITASIGVVVLIFTNLILIPVLLSYTGVSRRAAEHASHIPHTEAEASALWRGLLKFTERGPAAAAIAGGVALAVLGIVVMQDLQIGDLDPGAPELRAESRYNQDIAFTNENYSISSDIFAVIVKHPEVDGCVDYEALSMANELEWRLYHLPEVEGVDGLNVGIRRMMAGLNEGYPKLNTMFRNQDTINFAASELINIGYANAACTLWPLKVYLSDHKAGTLTKVVETLEQFNRDFPSDKVQFLGAAGSAGFEAATNIVVKKANREMMFYVYAAVLALCLLTFRSVAGVICAVLPLMLTSILCEALMVWLDIGVKVATLPVIALGVGVGVDYALYVLTVILNKTRAGMPLRQAYFETLNFTGRVVALIGVTLAAGVITWAWSPIKFQADMGILLTFMFLWNMVGALVLMPALAVFLLKVPAAEREAAGQADPVQA
ncbi:MAG: MMPL family transporter [Halioglobus sp.]